MQRCTNFILLGKRWPYRSELPSMQTYRICIASAYQISLRCRHPWKVLRLVLWVGCPSLSMMFSMWGWAKAPKGSWTGVEKKHSICPWIILSLDVHYFLGQAWGEGDQRVYLFDIFRRKSKLIVVLLPKYLYSRFNKDWLWRHTWNHIFGLTLATRPCGHATINFSSTYSSRLKVKH